MTNKSKEEGVDRITFEGFKAFHSGDLDEAIGYYNEALKIDPYDEYALNGKACTLYKLKEYQEVIKCCDRMLELDPSDASTMYWKGMNYYKLEEKEEANRCFDEAVELFTKIIEEEPDSLALRENKAHTLNVAGRYKEAIECCNEILEINKNDNIALGYREFANRRLMKGRTIIDPEKADREMTHIVVEEYL